MKALVKAKPKKGIWLQDVEIPEPDSLYEAGNHGLMM